MISSVILRTFNLTPIITLEEAELDHVDKIIEDNTKREGAGKKKNTKEAKAAKEDDDEDTAAGKSTEGETMAPVKREVGGRTKRNTATTDGVNGGESADRSADDTSLSAGGATETDASVKREEGGKMKRKAAEAGVDGGELAEQLNEGSSDPKKTKKKKNTKEAKAAKEGEPTLNVVGSSSTAAAAGEPPLNVVGSSSTAAAAGEPPLNVVGSSSTAVSTGGAVASAAVAPAGQGPPLNVVGSSSTSDNGKTPQEIIDLLHVRNNDSLAHHNSLLPHETITHPYPYLYVRQRC
jgi:hypothetical protein